MGSLFEFLESCTLVLVFWFCFFYYFFFQRFLPLSFPDFHTCTPPSPKNRRWMSPSPLSAWFTQNQLLCCRSPVTAGHNPLLRKAFPPWVGCFRHLPNTFPEDASRARCSLQNILKILPPTPPIKKSLITFSLGTSPAKGIVLRLVLLFF